MTNHWVIDGVCLTFKKADKLFSKVVVPFTFAAIYEDTWLPTLGIASVFNFRHFEGYLKVYHHFNFFS